MIDYAIGKGRIWKQMRVAEHVNLSGGELFSVPRKKKDLCKAFQIYFRDQSFLFYFFAKCAEHMQEERRRKNMRNSAIAAILICYVPYCFERAEFKSCDELFLEFLQFYGSAQGIQMIVGTFGELPGAVGIQSLIIFCSML